MITNPSNFSDQFKNFIEHIALTIKNGLNSKLSINKQTLSDKEKTQVKNNIGLPAEIAALKKVLASKSELSNYLLTTGKAASASTADTANTANTANTAINDSSGNNINNTYIKSVSVNGRTITFTRGNGTTFTITTQDTVTTNSSNWSVSSGTNGWARDNSTGFTIQWGKHYNNSYTNKGFEYVSFPRWFNSVLNVTAQQIFEDKISEPSNDVKDISNGGFNVSFTYRTNGFWFAIGFS